MQARSYRCLFLEAFEIIDFKRFNVLIGYFIFQHGDNSLFDGQTTEIDEKKRFSLAFALKK